MYFHAHGFDSRVNFYFITIIFFILVGDTFTAENFEAKKSSSF